MALEWPWMVYLMIKMRNPTNSFGPPPTDPVCEKWKFVASVTEWKQQTCFQRPRVRNPNWRQNVLWMGHIIIYRVGDKRKSCRPPYCTLSWGDTLSTPCIIDMWNPVYKITRPPFKPMLFSKTPNSYSHMYKGNRKYLHSLKSSKN